jgi:predicted dehydrogenase
MTDLKSERVELPDQEPLRAELEEFIDAVRAHRSPLIDGKRGLRGMQILELVRSSIIEQKEIVNEQRM